MPEVYPAHAQRRVVIAEKDPGGNRLANVVIKTNPAATFAELLPSNPRRKSFTVVPILAAGNIIFRPQGYPYAAGSDGWLCSTTTGQVIITDDLVGEIIMHPWEFQTSNLGIAIFVIECNHY